MTMVTVAAPTVEKRNVSIPRPTYIGRLILGMHTALQRLGVEPTNQQLESCAVFIHDSMSTSSRNYHSVKHVFDITEGWDDPIGILSAYFHDCIYYHVDGGFSCRQQGILRDVLTNYENKLLLNSNREDELLQLCLTIFGFLPDQDMSSTAGLNEFLSALTACRYLESLLDKGILAQIVCSIEATIPFRPNIDGKSYLDRLFDRMTLANQEFDLALSHQEIVEAVQRAALLSNRDLGNFGSTDASFFLDNTWSLLPELNKSLRHQYCYSVFDFHEAVEKMNSFFSFLQPNIIFCSFQGVPSSEELQSLSNQANRNLEIGRIYVGAKVLALSLLAAFATLTGGDAPMSLFLGDLPSRHHVSRRLEDLLPQDAPREDCDMEVYNILANGRKSETTFDIRQSPLAAFLYGCMGTDGIKDALRRSTRMPMTEKSAYALMQLLPIDAVTRIAHIMAKVAVSRSHLIMKVAEEILVPK